MIDIKKEVIDLARIYFIPVGLATDAFIALCRRVAAEQLEEDAKIAETIYPPAHTYASENAQIYRAQDETTRKIAATIRSRKEEEGR